MIRVQIGGSERDMTESIDGAWIHEQVERRRADGQPVCVRVNITESGVCLALTTPTCGGGGGGRAPNGVEREVIESWNEHRLNQVDFRALDLIAFLRQLRSLTGV